MRARLLFATLAGVVGVLLGLLTRRTVRGLENVPRRGGAIVACNHISVLDPLVLSHALWRARRRPRGVATAGLFRAPVLGAILRRLGFIPVARGTTTAAEALQPAEAELLRGSLVMMYPEGGISSGDQWPTRAKTGVARLALSTGVPIVPVAQWGVQKVYPAAIPQGWKWIFPAFITRPRVEVLIGEPFRVQGDSQNPDDVQRATTEVMAAVTALLIELRGDSPERLEEPDIAVSS